MAPMPGSDPTSRLVDGFVPAQIAPGGPEGPVLPGPASLAPLRVEPVSLCTLGPCRRYHELHTRLDAEEPIDGSDGGVRVAITRTCYPHAGIEIDLNGSPVKECNLWDPILTHTDREIAGARYQMANPDKYQDFVDSWMSTPNPDEDPTDGDR